VATVALVGTLDTKGPDYAFLAGRLRASGAGVIVVDAGTGTPAGITPDIPAEQVAAAAPPRGLETGAEHWPLLNRAYATAGPG
jgi:uncharacterized protein (UPF0261 family)